jgi:hypothetical protein
MTGLPHGSASGNSSEFLRIVRGFGGEVCLGTGAETGADEGVLGRWAGFAASSSTPGKVDAEGVRLGSLGLGKPATLLVEVAFLSKWVAYFFSFHQPHPRLYLRVPVPIQSKLATH